MIGSLLGIVALVLLLFAAISRRAQSWPLTPPMFFLLAGVAIGPGGLGLLVLDESVDVVHTLAEITLVLVLFTDASRISLSCLWREGSIPARLLGIGMPLTIAAGAGMALLLLPGLTGPEALLLAAILAPTDAALGQAVVSNPVVPARIRQALNVESGLNDGIALPVVLILASGAGAIETDRDGADWAQFALLAVTLGPAVGAAIGLAGARWLERGSASGWISGPYLRLSSLGLAFLAFGAAEFVGGNGFISAFVAGFALGNAGPSICPTVHEFGETEGQLMTLLVFLIFGAHIVPATWEHVPPSGWLYAIASLTIVRFVPVALALVGSGLRPPSVLFLAWFGPRGLASILFVLLVVEEGRLSSGPMLESIVMTTVLASTLLHGLTASPAAHRYGRYASATAPPAELESAPNTPVRIRHDAV